MKICVHWSARRLVFLHRQQQQGWQRPVSSPSQQSVSEIPPTRLIDSAIHPYSCCNTAILCSCCIHPHSRCIHPRGAHANYQPPVSRLLSPRHNIDHQPHSLAHSHSVAASLSTTPQPTLSISRSLYLNLAPFLSITPQLVALRAKRHLLVEPGFPGH